MWGLQIVLLMSEKTSPVGLQGLKGPLLELQCHLLRGLSIPLMAKAKHEIVDKGYSQQNNMNDGCCGVFL
jgi:hypothetical protein